MRRRGPGAGAARRITAPSSAAGASPRTRPDPRRGPRSRTSPARRGTPSRARARAASPAPTSAASFDARTDSGAPFRISPAHRRAASISASRGYDLADNPVRVRLGGGEPLAGEDDRHRRVPGEVAGQPVHAAGRRHQPHPRFGQSERRMLGRDDDVAGEYQLEPAAQREPVHRRDDGLVAPGAAGQPAEAARDPPAQLSHPIRAVLRLELQIVARAKRPIAGAGEDRHPLLVVGLEGVERVVHLLGRVGMKGVHHLRAVDRHGGDVVGRRYLDELVAHGFPLPFGGIHAWPANRRNSRARRAGRPSPRHHTAIFGMLGRPAAEFLQTLLARLPSSRRDMCRSHSTSHETVTAIPVAASYLSSGNPLRKFASAGHALCAWRRW